MEFGEQWRLRQEASPLRFRNRVFPLSQPIITNIGVPMQKFVSVLLLSAFVVAVSGCDDGKLKTYPVSGTVAYKGEPLAGATVSFSPKTTGEGNTGFAQTDANGFYQLQTTLGRVNAGTTPGEYYVTIVKVESVGTGTFAVSDGVRFEIEKTVSNIPEKYGSIEAGLTATVVKGKNVFNFDLE